MWVDSRVLFIGIWHIKRECSYVADMNLASVEAGRVDTSKAS